MKLLSYNIYLGGASPDPGRFAHLLRLINREQPDVLALNECNHFEQGGYRRLHEVERALGMVGYLALASTGFHVAIFLRNAAVFSHQPEGGFHHAALVVEGALGGQPMRFVTAHLCPFGGSTRLCEAELLTRFARPDLPTVIFGDLNALSRRDAAQIDTQQFNARLRARHTLPLLPAGLAHAAGTRLSSNPSAQPQPEIDTRALDLLEAVGFIDLFRKHHPAKRAITAPTELRAPKTGEQVRIDYILANAAMAARSLDCRIIDDAEARAASDHLPVVAEFS